MKLLNAPDYIADATRAINAAQHRVLLLSLVIADDPSSHELIDALLVAARRGVHVSVAGDVFTYGEISGSFLPLSYYSKPARSVTNMVKLFRSVGVQFHWLGRSHATIFTGRTHSKWCVVDDTVYSFGGVNVFQSGIDDNVDFMLKSTSPALAEWIAAEHQRIITSDRSGRPQRGRRLTLSQSTVITDGGIAGNSPIYKRACELAKEATAVTFVSQYPPTGALSRLLRSRKHALYFNRPERAKGLNRLAIRFSQWRDPAGTKYRRRRYIHAKFIIFTMPDGAKVALTGSHNFNFNGVLFGTREIALETRNRTIIQQLETFVAKEIR